MLYGGMLEVVSIFRSSVCSTGARSCISACDIFSACELCAFGRIHVSNGNRAAYGASQGEVIGLMNHANRCIGFLRQDVAVDAPFLVVEVMLGAIQFFLDALGHDRQRDQLRMRVLQHRSRRLAMVFAENR